jgi:hypothetical protein
MQWIFDCDAACDAEIKYRRELLSTAALRPADKVTQPFLRGQRRDWLPLSGHIFIYPWRLKARAQCNKREQAETLVTTLAVPVSRVRLLAKAWRPLDTTTND